MGLSAGELASIRRTADQFLPDVCVINQAGAGSLDADGNWTPGAPTQTTVACRISPGQYQFNEQVTGGELHGLQPWIITLPAGTAVSEKDQITSGGRTFDVTGVAGPRSLEISRRVYAVERT